MGTEATETLSELRGEIDRVHGLYLAAYAELKKAREANQELRRKIAEVYVEASENARDHTTST